MLRAGLLCNPWQLGSDRWSEVAEMMQTEFRNKFTIATVKGRINLLIDKYRKQELSHQTGTEEELSERGKLLQQIIAIKSEEDAAINVQLNADYEMSDNENCEYIDGENVAEEVIGPENVGLEDVGLRDVSLQDVGWDDHILRDITREEENERLRIGYQRPSTNSIAKQRRLERLEADTERDAYIAAGPSSERGKRQRLSLEEEIILERQQHDMKLEKDRLELEKEREKRLREEGLRRDEIAKSQLQIQQTMLEMMQKFMSK